MINLFNEYNLLYHWDYVYTKLSNNISPLDAGSINILNFYLTFRLIN